jgi:hypothetical protein
MLCFNRWFHPRDSFHGSKVPGTHPWPISEGFGEIDDNQQTLQGRFILQLQFGHPAT